jgi:hypothetical protein
MRGRPCCSRLRWHLAIDILIFRQLRFCSNLTPNTGLSVLDSSKVGRSRHCLNVTHNKVCGGLRHSFVRNSTRRDVRCTRSSIDVPFRSFDVFIRRSVKDIARTRQQAVLNRGHHRRSHHRGGRLKSISLGMIARRQNFFIGSSARDSHCEASVTRSVDGSRVCGIGVSFRVAIRRGLSNRIEVLLDRKIRRNRKRSHQRNKYWDVPMRYVEHLSGRCWKKRRMVSDVFSTGLWIVSSCEDVFYRRIYVFVRHDELRTRD